MSILSVDNISPIGSGTSVTVNKSVTLESGNTNITGVCTATSFVGGLPITNGADNRVITASSASAIQGESGFTFNGSLASIINSSGPTLELTTNTNAADASLRLHEGTTGSTTNGGGMFYSGADNKLHITCGTTLTSKRITILRDDGKVGIGTDNPTTALEVKGDITVYNSNNQGDIFFGENGNVSNSKALIRMDQLSSTAGQLQFHTEGGGTLTNRMTIQSTGGVQISAVKNVSATASNHTGTFNSAELIMTTPTYSEYHYTWSGHSSYTIDLTCGSYFHSEFTYVQHQTNGGTAMNAYIRGKWANNHQTHTLMIHEWSGGAAGLLVDMVASDQNGNGAVNGENGLTAQGWSNASYRGMYGGGGENYDNTSSANGRLRISESFGHWGGASVSSRGLIVRVYFGSFAISKS